MEPTSYLGSIIAMKSKFAQSIFQLIQRVPLKTSHNKIKTSIAKCNDLASRLVRKDSPFQVFFGHLQKSGWFRSLYKNEIYKRYHDRWAVNKILLNTLRWADHVICLGEDDPAWQTYRGNIYVNKGDMAYLTSNEAMVYVRTRSSVRDIELMDLNAKPGCLEIFTKADLHRTS